MPHQVDDFKISQWVAISDCHKTGFSPFTGDYTVGEKMMGLPLLIKGINLPYVAVEVHNSNGKSSSFLDVRDYTFIKLNRKYVNLLKFPEKKEEKVVVTNVVKRTKKVKSN